MSRAIRRSENKKMFNKIIKHKMNPILDMKISNELFNCLNNEEKNKFKIIMSKVILSKGEEGEIYYCTKNTFKDFNEFENIITEKYKDIVETNKIISLQNG